MGNQPGKKSRGIRLFLVIPAMLSLLLFLAAAAAWNGINGKRAVDSDEGEPVVVTIPRGSSAGSIAGSLQRHGVLSQTHWFRALIWARGAERGLKAGTYRFEGRMSTADVLDTLLAGSGPTDFQVTIPEGLTVRETVRRLADSGLGSSAGFEQAILELMPLVHAFDPLSGDAEGYLFPDTYRFAKSWPEKRIIRVLLARFLEAAVRTVGRTPGGAAGGLDLREAVTLASLVEKETAVDAERVLVAGVFANRLDLGMRMQCDPTVLYALRRSGRSVTRLLRADLEYDSPWNTYRYAGLPPGPICCPGEASLRAACRPADTGYLYFVADGRGGHRFSSTIGEHNRAVARYRAWQRQHRN